MTQSEKINELIAESKNHQFANNCYTQTHGTYGRASVEFQVWFAECEDVILHFYGETSTPYKFFKKARLERINGNGKDKFVEQIGLVVTALELCLKLSSRSVENKTIIKSELNYTQVFIVHGHDEEAKSKAARFVEKLGFEAIILHEQASSSKTIIEKIEEYSNVGFGIILYTPCDIGAKKCEKPDLKSRARQNVIFEHGFLIGKIGRSRVCAIVKGDVETPNDISGVVYVSMDASDAWCYSIAKEMKKAGYKVDMNKI
jgi:predicted nucleotide-binding protein